MAIWLLTPVSSWLTPFGTAARVVVVVRLFPPPFARSMECYGPKIIPGAFQSQATRLDAWCIWWLPLESGMKRKPWEARNCAGMLAR